MWHTTPTNASIISNDAYSLIWFWRGQSQALALQSMVSNTRRRKRTINNEWSHEGSKLTGQVSPVTSIYLMSQSLAKPFQIKLKGSQGLKHAHKTKRSQKVAHTTMLQQPNQIPQLKCATNLISQHLHHVFTS